MPRMYGVVLNAMRANRARNNPEKKPSACRDPVVTDPGLEEKLKKAPPVPTAH